MKNLCSFKNLLTRPVVPVKLIVLLIISGLIFLVFVTEYMAIKYEISHLSAQKGVPEFNWMFSR